MKKYYVYVHVCPNEKRYVGCTVKRKPEYRWGKNGKSYRFNKCFYFDILKYGWDNIEHEVFEVDSEEEMYRKEVELISFYHSNDPRYGYNHSSGGEYGHSGCKHSEEAREKMSQTRKKKWTDLEYKEKMFEANKKSHSDPEYRKRVSEAAKRGWLDPEIRRKRSEAMKGKPKPKVKIKLPNGTTIEIAKNILVKNYVNKGRKFEYVS